MTLTKKDKRKLAKAARELAGEYAEERGPELEASTWCGCAAGQVFKRADVPNKMTDATDYRMPSAFLDIDLFESTLTIATARQVYGSFVNGKAGKPIPGAVVFPLLYLADVLEESAR